MNSFNWLDYIDSYYAAANPPNRSFRQGSLSFNYNQSFDIGICGSYTFASFGFASFDFGYGSYGFGAGSFGSFNLNIGSYGFGSYSSFNIDNMSFVTEPLNKYGYGIDLV